MKLTEQQKRFAEIHIDLRFKNATQAAIDAGYSKKTASSQASQLLKNPKVLEYIEIRKNELIKDLQQKFIFDALEARDIMYKIMLDSDADNKDKINVAKDFLDRAGFKAKDKIEVDGISQVVFSGEGELSE